MSNKNIKKVQLDLRAIYRSDQKTQRFTKFFDELNIRWNSGHHFDSYQDRYLNEYKHRYLNVRYYPHKEQGRMGYGSIHADKKPGYVWCDDESDVMLAFGFNKAKEKIEEKFNV